MRTLEDLSAELTQEEREQVAERTRDLQAWNQRVLAIGVSVAASGVDQEVTKDVLSELTEALGQAGVELVLVARAPGLPDVQLDVDELFPTQTD